VDEAAANSLKGKRVVVTRAEEQSGALVRALQKKGAVPVLAPMVAFGPPDDPAMVDAAIRGMARYDWIFLTSQNALRALRGRCESLRVPLARVMRASSIAAVGPATAEAARNAGLRVEYVAERHQGSALVEELAGRIKGKRVLLPRSDRANPELVHKLERLGARVNEIIAYRTVRPAEQALAEAGALLRDGAEAVLFFSPSAVHHLQEILGNEKFLALSRAALFTAIGPVTEEALRKAKVERVRTAEDATVGAVLEVLTDYFTASELKMPAGAKPK
jgi:uroporphyrinogen-III synthase